MRGALAAMLSREQDLDVVAELDRADDVLATALRVRPHVAVLDFGLPGTTKVTELCQTLCLRLPACRVLTVLDQHTCAAASRSLAQLMPRVGLLATDASPPALVDGVRRLARGEPVLDLKLAVAALTASDSLLTEREREVLSLARHGATTKEIARSLCLSTGTVRNYLSRTLTKTGARSRIDAIRIAQEAGWI